MFEMQIQTYIVAFLTGILLEFLLFSRNEWDRHLRFYVKLRKLHQQHSDFVRIRPREISICNPDAIVDVHGPKNNIRKAEWYEQNYPFHTLQHIRVPAHHKRQRRYWDKAFHTKALQEYTPQLTEHYNIMLNTLARHAASGTPIDASAAFMDLFFDVISHLSFGKSFNTLTNGQRNPILRHFLKRQRAVGYALLNMWMLHLIRNLAMPRKKLEDWERWYDNALEERRKMQTTTPDIYTYLSQSDEFEYNGAREAKLAVVAGADTNAITVSNVCNFLCQHGEYQAQLHEELSGLPILNGIIDDQHLIGKPYLTGIINEALRLHPPVPSGLHRLTPPEGAVIAGRFIPGDMVVTTPTYSLHRDPRAFLQPDEFIPERWSSQPELILRKDAFLPFGYGAYNCAGRPLALLQLRMVVAMVCNRFEISFAPGKEAECLQFQNQADCFTLHLERLPLLLKERPNGR
ncbi:cytochrome P450 [Clathrospora elynae]|uniref:Cytochrome P450 n=1 Tax=Clathrospora elynae TaxID=706981 RepID=A0A6A5T6P1_9PLEO|nr:cytochrome P450 [Clathrospora elynae]